VSRRTARATAGVWGGAVVCLLVTACLVVILRPLPAVEPTIVSQFRIRPYLQNPAPDAMTIRWFSETSDRGTVSCDGRSFTSAPELCHDLVYQPTEPADRQFAAPPFRHTVRVTGLEPATSYPYTVEQSGEKAQAVLTTAPRPGEVGQGGGVRLFFYADGKAQPDSRTTRTEWVPSASFSAGPRPSWVGGRYPVERTVAYRTNLALIATRAAESLRAGNPVLASIVGNLVASGGEQRHWDEFWRHNAGTLGTLAARVPVVVAPGDRESFGGPATGNPLTDRGGFGRQVVLLAARKFSTYFDLPPNNAADERHEGRYFRLDFGPVTLLSLDSTNGGIDRTADDTNHELDREAAPHLPDYVPGTPQHDWLVRELAAARDRGAITFVQFHHAAFSSGRHGRPPGDAGSRDRHSGQPLRALAPLFRAHGVRAVFSGHDELYEHSFTDGVHYYTIGIGGGGLPDPLANVVNAGQVFQAHDHAPERWRGDVLESGGRHYGHLEVDVVQRANGTGFTVTITPVHVFPVLSGDRPGDVVDWERRIYEDVLTFEVEARP
jgi:hypothetical protein